MKPAGATVAHAAIQFTVAKGAVAATHKLAWLSHLWTWPKIAMGSAAACAVTATVIASGVVTRQDKTSAPPQYAAAQIPDALQSRDLNSNAGNTPAENSSVDADLAWITAYSKKTFDAIVSAKYLVDISGKQSEEPFTLEVTGTVSQRPHDGFELLRLAGQYHYTDVFLKAHQDRSTKSNVVEFVGPQSAGVYHPGNPYAQEFSYPRVSEMSAEAHMAVAGTGAPHPEFYMFGDGLTKEFLWDNVLKTKDQTSMYRWRVESEKRPTGSPRWHLFVYIFARNGMAGSADTRIHS